MAKRRSIYHSLKKLASVPLRDLKPIKVENNKRSLNSMSVRKRVSLVVIICLVMMIVTISVGHNWGPLNTVLTAAASPFQRLFTMVSSSFSNRAEERQTNDELRAENEKLKTMIYELQYESTLNQMQLQKLEELKALYDMDTYYAEYPKTGAQIISWSSSNWSDAITIDKGTADGIERYMAVIAGGGLFGHVDTVYEQFARVTSILSEDSSVYCEVFRTSDRVRLDGDLQLKNDGLCKIIFDIDQVSIAVGDEIVTSYGSTVYPPGIRVGEVTSVDTSGDGITGIALVKPYADIQSTTYLLIMTDVDKIPITETQKP